MDIYNALFEAIDRGEDTEIIRLINQYSIKINFFLLEKALEYKSQNITLNQDYNPTNEAIDALLGPFKFELPYLVENILSQSIALNKNNLMSMLIKFFYENTQIDWTRLTYKAVHNLNGHFILLLKTYDIQITVNEQHHYDFFEIKDLSRSLLGYFLDRGIYRCINRQEGDDYKDYQCLTIFNFLKEKKARLTVKESVILEDIKKNVQKYDPTMWKRDDKGWLNTLFSVQIYNELPNMIEQKKSSCVIQ